MVFAQNEQKILVQENIPSPYFPVIVLEVHDLLDSYSPCHHIVLARRRYIAAAQYCRQRSESPTNVRLRVCRYVSHDSSYRCRSYTPWASCSVATLISCPSSPDVDTLCRRIGSRIGSCHDGAVVPELGGRIKIISEEGSQ